MELLLQSCRALVICRSPCLWCCRADAGRAQRRLGGRWDGLLPIAAGRGSSWWSACGTSSSWAPRWRWGWRWLGSRAPPSPCRLAQAAPGQKHRRRRRKCVKVRSNFPCTFYAMQVRAIKYSPTNGSVIWINNSSVDSELRRKSWVMKKTQDADLSSPAVPASRHGSSWWAPPAGTRPGPWARCCWTACLRRDPCGWTPAWSVTPRQNTEGNRWWRCGKCASSPTRQDCPALWQKMLLS